MWLAIWFLVVLKIPILYLAYVIWWSVKDPPEGFSADADAPDEDGGLGRPPGGRRPRRGPERKPVRKHSRTQTVRAGTAR